MSYFKEVSKELKKVTWPSAADTNHFTWISISFIVIFALYFGLTDTVFSSLISWFISL